MTFKHFLLLLFVTTAPFSATQAKQQNKIFEPGSNFTDPTPNSLAQNQVTRAYTKEMAHQAGTSGTEPDFERFIELFNAKFSKWLDEKNINSSDKASKAYLAMNSALYAARNNALHAANKVANKPDDNTAFGSALSTVRTAVLYEAMTTYCAGFSSSEKISMILKFNATWYTAAAAAKDLMDGALDKTSEHFTRHLKPNGPNTAISAALAYRIAEREALIYLYDKLFKVLDAAYEAQEGRTWEVSKAVLVRVIEKLIGASNAEKQLFSPFTEELRRRVDELPDKKFLGIW